MNFTVNQVRQMYVASAYGSSVSDASATGALGGFKKVAGRIGDEVYFLYKGADTVLKSDAIQLANLGQVKAYKASDLILPLKSVEVTLGNTDSGAPSTPISGQDYVLRIEFKQFYGMSDGDQYFKNVAVHATSDMTAAGFYKALVKALNSSFSREPGATATTNPYLTFALDDNSTPTKVIITEKEQEWSRTKRQRRIQFNVVPTTVYSGGEDVIWGTVTDATAAKADAVAGSTGIGNGKRIADLEVFCMGERGDQYRGVNWPNYIPTTYLVDPSKEYNVLEIHYAFTDSGVNSYRTEKEITIVAPVGASGHEYDVINSIITAFNSAAGTSVATLS